MRTINHDRRAVALFVLGVALWTLTILCFTFVKIRVDRKVLRDETALSQMEDYRKGGVRAFLEDGRVTIYGGWDREDAPVKSVFDIVPETYEQAYERLAKEKRMFLKEQERKKSLTLPHPANRCPECLKGDGRLHVYGEYFPEELEGSR